MRLPGRASGRQVMMADVNNMKDESEINQE